MKTHPGSPPMERAPSHSRLSALALLAVVGLGGSFSPAFALQEPPARERCVCIHPDRVELERSMDEARLRIREIAPHIRDLEVAIGDLDIRIPELDGRVRLFPALAGARLGLTLDGEADTETESMGARVVSVTRGSGADEAGLQEGDVITRFGDHDLTRPLADEDLREGESAPTQRLVRLAGELQEGDTVRIVYVRDGRTETTTVEARRLSSVREIRIAPSERNVVVRPVAPRVELTEPVRIFSSFSTAGRLGLQLAPLNDDLGSYFGRAEGALVLQVSEDSPFSLRAGDVIIRIGDREVSDPGHAMEILRSYRANETVRMEVWRERRSVTVEGTVP